jgi:hypothetical protein
MLKDFHPLHPSRRMPVRAFNPLTGFVADGGIVLSEV